MESKHADILELNQRVSTMETKNTELAEEVLEKENELENQEKKKAVFKLHVNKIEKKCKKLQKETRAVETEAIRTCLQFKRLMRQKVRHTKDKMKLKLNKMMKQNKSVKDELMKLKVNTQRMMKEQNLKDQRVGLEN